MHAVLGFCRAPLSRQSKEFMSEELLFTAISLLITVGLLGARGFFMMAVRSHMDRCYVITFRDDRGPAILDGCLSTENQKRIPTTVNISVVTRLEMKRAGETRRT